MSDAAHPPYQRRIETMTSVRSSSYAVAVGVTQRSVVPHPTLESAMAHSRELGASPHEVLEFCYEVVRHARTKGESE